MAFTFGAPVTAAEALVRDASGARKAHDGNVVIDGEAVLVDNAGATDFAATDVVTVLAHF
jgi:ATP-dependent DNA ligase